MKTDDEIIEIMAAAMFLADYDTDKVERWTAAPPGVRKIYIDLARAGLTAYRGTRGER